MRIKLFCLLLCAILAGTLSTTAGQHHHSVVEVQSVSSESHSSAEARVENDDSDSDNDSDDADSEDNKNSVSPRKSTLDGDLIAIFEDSVLKSGKAVNNVITVYGNSSIQGEVFGSIVIVGGNLALNSKVHGDVVVVGGSVDLGSDAKCLGNTIVVGGGFKKSLGAQINKSPFIIGGAPFLFVLSWIKNGLLLGRPVVPSLMWVWGIIGVFFILYCLLALLLRKALAAGVEACETHPVGSLLTGLLFFMILTPLLASLVFSGFGIILLPFMVCPLILLACVGRLFVYVTIGCMFLKQLRPPGYGVVVALAIGMALCVLLGMIPFVGFLVWGFTGVMGIGTIILACFQYLSRERKSSKQTPPPTYPTPPSIPTVSAAAPPTPSSSVAPVAATSSITPTDANPIIPPPQALKPEPQFQSQSIPVPNSPTVVPPPAPAQPPVSAKISVAPALISEPRVNLATPAAKTPPPVIQASTPPILASQSFPLAGFGLRLCSLALDLIVVTGCLALINCMRLFPLGLLVYYIVFLALRGATLGDLVTGIKCVHMTGTPMNWGTAIVRSLCSIFSIVPLGLGFFWTIWDPRKQSWHDRIANTILIKTPGSN